MSKNIHRFTVSVNCHLPDDSAVTDQVQSFEQLYDDYGVLLLPDSYSKTGEPTRLVFSLHGGGSQVAKNDSQIEHLPMTKYLVANGYAVMDVNGMPEKFAAEKNISVYDNIGSPITIRSLVKAYHYCMERFNLKREVFVHGGSMSGLGTTNLVLSGMIPVIAHSLWCPVLDTYEQVFLRPWCNGEPKIVLSTLCGFDKDENGEFIYDEAKVGGYNPAKNKKAERYPVPLKIWHCIDDPIVPYFVTEKYVDVAQANGSQVYLRTFTYGLHRPDRVGTPVEKPLGKDVYDGEKIDVMPAMEEAFIWIRNFD